MKGQVGAELGLDEGIAPKHLVKGGKRFKCSRAAAEAALPVSGGDEKSSLQAENRTAIQVGEHDALEGEGHVPKASMPDVVLILKLYWHVHFDLVLGAESLLVNDVGLHAGSALRIGRA